MLTNEHGSERGALFACTALGVESAARDAPLTPPTTPDGPMPGADPSWRRVMVSARTDWQRKQHACREALVESRLRPEGSEYRTVTTWPTTAWTPDGPSS